ncbi:MAG: carbohydrate kinase family protein [Anaerolineales bacterium]|nr:carbohydrate kinase family protein [Anaerolineales bacterium]
MGASSGTAPAASASDRRTAAAMTSDIPSFLFAGPVRREFFLTWNGKAHSRLLGGPALYAAAGAKPWTAERVGIVSRVGPDLGGEAAEEVSRAGLNGSGIRVLPECASDNAFHYFETPEKRIDWDPAKFYAKHNLACPRELLHYSPVSLPEHNPQAFPENALRRDDIPPSYRSARAACIISCHYQSLITLSVALRQSGVGTILLAPPDGLLLPSYRRQVREILHGTDIFFSREEPIRAFTGDPPPGENEISEILSDWGPKIILLQRGNQGIRVFDAEARKGRFVPFYPAEIVNPLAIGAAFCGGFLAEWCKSYDVLESTLTGCISASLAAEGYGALYALRRNPQLAAARLISLRSSLPK